MSNWSLWLNGWVFFYELNDCGLWGQVLSQSLSYFIYRTCFEQGVSWHSCSYILWIQSKRVIWHDKILNKWASFYKLLECNKHFRRLNRFSLTVRNNDIRWLSVRHQLLFNVNLIYFLVAVVWTGIVKSWFIMISVPYLSK